MDIAIALLNTVAQDVSIMMEMILQTIKVQNNFSLLRLSLNWKTNWMKNQGLQCNVDGTMKISNNGICICNVGYAGQNCDKCDSGFVGQNCSQCEVGFVGLNCDLCDNGYTGINCSICDIGFIQENGLCKEGK